MTTHRSLTPLETRLTGALTEIAAMTSPARHASPAPIEQPPSRPWAAGIAAAAVAAALLGTPVLLAVFLKNDPGPAPQDGSVISPTVSQVDVGPRSEVEEAANALTAFEPEPGYGRTAVSYDDRRIIVFWKGPLPPAVTEAIEDIPPTITVVVRQVQFSASDLLAAGSRLIAASQAGRWDTKVVSASPMGDLSGLVVEVLNPDAVSTSELAAVARVPVEVRQGGPVREL